jgi:hypothetical protein
MNPKTAEIALVYPRPVGVKELAEDILSIIFQLLKRTEKLTDALYPSFLPATGPEQASRTLKAPMRPTLESCACE